MYAVLETGGKQYRVSAGDVLEIEKLEAEPGATLSFDRVLLVSGEAGVRIGAPTVAGVKVHADVVEQKRGEKKIIWKMNRRKGYHKKQGHRQSLTVVRIKDIEG
jgi:large subunit ribosomal protein L21